MSKMLQNLNNNKEKQRKSHQNKKTPTSQKNTLEILNS